MFVIQQIKLHLPKDQMGFIACKFGHPLVKIASNEYHLGTSWKHNGLLYQWQHMLAFLRSSKFVWWWTNRSISHPNLDARQGFSSKSSGNQIFGWEFGYKKANEWYLDDRSKYLDQNLDARNHSLIQFSIYLARCYGDAGHCFGRE